MELSPVEVPNASGEGWICSEDQIETDFRLSEDSTMLCALRDVPRGPGRYTWLYATDSVPFLNRNNVTGMVNRFLTIGWSTRPPKARWEEGGGAKQK